MRVTLIMGGAPATTAAGEALKVYHCSFGESAINVDRKQRGKRGSGPLSSANANLD